VKSAEFWGLFLPIAILVGMIFDLRMLALAGLYPIQALRIQGRMRTRGWSRTDAALYAGACLLAKFAHSAGALRFHRTRLLGGPQRLIEYRIPATPPSQSPVRLVELVNQYPQTSHTFVRREIRGLESCGFAVERISIRETREELADIEDRKELARTRSLLAAGPIRILAAAARCAVERPLRMAAVAIDCVRLARLSGRSLLVHVAYLFEACLLLRWCRQSRADWVHAHFGTNAATVAMLCRRLGGPPFSFTVHGPEEFDQPRALALGEKVRESGFAVAISSFGRSQLMRWCGFDYWSRIHVVRCGIEPRMFPERTPIPDAPRLLCVARLSEQKGLFVLIDALERLSRAGVRFEMRIAGDGPLREEIARRLSRTGLEEHVQLLGWCSGEQVRHELEHARGLVLPSFAEGLPVVLMEALGSGRPVVSTFVAGIPELVKNGDNGWLVPSGDAAELAGAVRELLETPVARLEAMGERGAKCVAEMHDAGASAAELGRLIRMSLSRAEEGASDGSHSPGAPSGGTTDA
jgi:glycosyltransferase involved in cell wall biosynthesis